MKEEISFLMKKMGVRKVYHGVRKVYTGAIFLLYLLSLFSLLFFLPTFLLTLLVLLFLCLSFSYIFCLVCLRDFTKTYHT